MALPGGCPPQGQRMVDLLPASPVFYLHLGGCLPQRRAELVFIEPHVRLLRALRAWGCMQESNTGVRTPASARLRLHGGPLLLLQLASLCQSYVERYPGPLDVFSAKTR